MCSKGWSFIYVKNMKLGVAEDRTIYKPNFMIRTKGGKPVEVMLLGIWGGALCCEWVVHEQERREHHLSHHVAGKCSPGPEIPPQHS